MVGDAQDWLKDIKEKALDLKISAGHEADADLGPLISPEAKKRVEDLIQSAVDEGAELYLDGRNPTVEKYPNGNFVGPTIITNMSTDMKAYKEEIFGPVLCVVNGKIEKYYVKPFHSNIWSRSIDFTDFFILLFLSGYHGWSHWSR